MLLFWLIVSVVSGLAKAYNVGSTFAIGASALGVAYAGDLLNKTWSIGGPYSPTIPIGNAPGLVGTHNKYEGDGSPTRVS